MHLRRWGERGLVRFSRQVDSQGVSQFTQSRERGGWSCELALLQQLEIGDAIKTKPPELLGRFGCINDF